MSGSSASRRGTRLLVALQVAVIVATLFSPLPAAAADDPPVDPPPSSEPTPTPASTPASTPEATPEPTPEATPEPTPEPTPMPTPDPALATEPYIVTFVAGVAPDDKDTILASVGAVETGAIHQLRMRTILLDPSTDAAAVATLRDDSRVARVDADRLRVAEEAPSDPSYAAQWALPQIEWDTARGTFAASEDAVAAVLDTGVDTSHPDLDDSIVTGASILEGSTWSDDPNGHGTAMAGIIAAETDNGQGVAGVGYARVKVMPVTVLAADGTGQDSDVIAGVVWAADHGADVILMAFSSGSYSASLQAAIDYAWSSGAVMVAAAGNDGSSAGAFPAGDRGVIGVSNTTQTDELAIDSNFGASVFLGAPGVALYTTDAGGGYRLISGTSASAAVVAGAAAELFAVDPSASNGVVVGRLARNADPAGTQGETGNGRVNLVRALGDTATDPVKPVGSAPVGDGGPFVGPYVASARIVTAATLNGGAAVNVSPGANISASVSVTTNNGGGNQNWRSTGWRISTTAPGAVTCFNNPNHDGSGNYGEAFTITAPSLPGTYNVYFIAYSDDGCSNQASNTFTLPNGVVVPQLTVTINQAVGQNDPTSTSPINFTVVFNRSVTGFATGDVTFTGSTSGGSKSGAVTGSGATYNVAVTGMTSRGTVVASIAAGVALDVAGNGNTASSSTDNSVIWDRVPVSTPQSVSTSEDSALLVTLSSTDPDNDNQIFSVVAGPANGTLGTMGIPVCAGGGPRTCTAVVTYTPSANFNGPDSFTFKTNDGLFDSNTATVSITVTEVNDVPVAVDDTDTVAEDGSATTSVLANDSTGPANESGQTLSVTTVTQGTDGSVTTNGTTVTYTPAPDFNGSDSFTYTACDNGTTNAVLEAKCDTATVSITVTEVNDDPVAVDDSATLPEDSSTTAINVLANDTDGPDSGETLAVVAVSVPANGTAAFTASGLTYTPDADYFGSDSFTYTIGDGNGGSDTATVTVTVTEVNDTPDAIDDSATVAEDALATTIVVLGNDLEGPTNEASQSLAVTAVSDPANGTTAIVDPGTPLNPADDWVTYTPDPDFNGSDSFTYSACDDGTTNGSPDPLCDSATVSITVTEVNDRPVGFDDTGTANEDGSTDLDVLANDSAGPADEAGQTLSISGLSDPANGTASIDDNGTPGTGDDFVHYVPDANFFGTDTFLYLVCDDGTTSGSADPQCALFDATVTVTVNAVNDAPIFTAGADQTTAEDAGPQSVPGWASAISAGPANESGQAVDFLVGNDNTALFSSQPAISPSGTLTYTPAPDANGSALVTVAIHDDGGTVDGGVDTSASQTITITVTEVNDTPDALDDTDTVAEDGNVTTSVLTNDSTGPANESSQTLTVTIETPGADGSVTTDGTTVTYTPDPDFNGSDSFTYSACDDGTTNGSPDPLCDSATVSITVTEVNDAPVAVADNDTVAEDGSTDLDVLANDSEGPLNEASQTLSITAVTQGTSGSVTTDGTTVTYTPDPDFNGTDSFTYTACDNGTTNAVLDAKCDIGTVSTTVTEVNDDPDAVDDSDSVAEDESVTISVLDNDSTGPANESTQTLTVTLVTQGADGSVTTDGTTVTYTPDPDFFGSDSFTYTACDDGTTAGSPDSLCNTATVSITVTEVNDVPVAVDDTDTVAEDGSATTSVLANDSTGPANESGQTLSVTTVTQGTDGSVTTNGTTVTYTPAPDFNGSDSFTYTACDNGTTNAVLEAKCDTATVSITVTEVNDDPVAVDDSATLPEDSSATTSVLANDSTGPANESTQTLTVTAVTDGSIGSVTTDGTTVTYTPDTDFFGNDSFTYTITDDGTTNGLADPRTDTATVFITVTEVNDTPDALDDTDTVAEDGNVTTSVLTNDSTGPANESSQTLTVTIETPGADGSVTTDGTTVTYTPDPDFNGSDSFTYSACDDGTTNGSPDPLCDSATVSITVTEVNDRPVGFDDTGTANEDGSTDLDVLANDSAGPADEAGQTLSISGLSDPANGTASIDDNGTPGTGDDFVHYVPDANFFGTDTFLYLVCDDGTTSGSADPQCALFDATVTVTVNAVNDAPILDLIGDQAVDEGVALEFTATANDVDLDTLTFSLDDGTSGSVPAGAAISAAGAFAWTPTEAQGFGSYTFDVCVSDGSLDDCETIEVVVAEVNVAPILAPIGSQVVDEGSTLMLDVDASDDDLPANTLAFSLIGAPIGATIDPVTGQFAWTPSDDGSHTFIVRVTDDGTPSLHDEEQITVAVSNVPPTVDAGAATGSSAEGSAFSRSGSFSDPGADTWTATVNYGDGSGVQPLTLAPDKTFSLDHTYVDSGTYTIAVAVTDDDFGVGSDSIAVTVNNVAPAVVLDAANDLTADEGSTLAYAFSISDPGTDTVTTVTVSCGPNGSQVGIATFSDTAGSFACTFADGPNSSTISASATDSDGATGAAHTQLVAIANVAPTTPALVAPTDNAITSDGTPLFDWTTSTDPAGALDTIQFAIQADNDGCTFTSPELNATGLTSSDYTPAANLADGTYCWRVRANDEDGGTSAFSTTRNVTIDTVAPATPSLVSPAANALTNDNTPTFDWSDVTDPSGVTYRLQVAAGTACTFGATAIDEAGITPSSHAPATSLADGTYCWRVRADDGATNSSAYTTGRLVRIDATAPTSTVAFPAGGSHDAFTWNAGCATALTGDVCGAAADAGPAVISLVQIALKNSAGLYWTGVGNAFTSPTAVWLSASGTTSWNRLVPFSAFPAAGSYTISSRATDSAGNVQTALASNTFGVINPSGGVYVFEGFFSPIDNPPILNKANAGNTIPVKWRITLNGNPVANATSFVALTSSLVSCGEMADLAPDDIESYSTNSGLQYNNNGNWHFNWKTPKTYANQCRVMTLTLNDGSTHDADFKFK